MKSVEESVALLKSQGVHSVLTQFCDLHGVAKGKLVPLKPLREWDEYSLHVSDWELQRYANRLTFHIAK